MLKSLILKVNFLVLLLLLIELKIRYPTYLIKRTEYDAKLSEIEAKYSTTSNYNIFTNEILDIKVKGKGLIYKSDISSFIDNSDLDKIILTLVTKEELKENPYKMVQLQAFDSSFYCSKSHFEDDRT